MVSSPDDSSIRDEKRFSTLCARINAAMDLEDFIIYLNYHPEKAIYSGGVWRLLCPIHEEKVFRTLIINPRRNTCFCEHINCSAHTHGDLIELLVKTRRMPRALVVIQILDHFGAEKLRLSDDQEEFLRGFYTRKI